jgi:hypothetical protein
MFLIPNIKIAQKSFGKEKEDKSRVDKEEKGHENEHEYITNRIYPF